VPLATNEDVGATQKSVAEDPVYESHSQHGTIPGLPPSTPIMRLPLADLIGNAEDALTRPMVKEQSPEEQLGWIPNSSNSALTPGQRRKRSNSSSPMSSSQHETSTHFALREPLDLQHMHQSLKTPYVDPAADLWSRYATGRNPNDTPSVAKLPAFAQLLNESSPRQLPRTPDGSVSGLRRWASCGIEWPTSKAKRRRPNAVLKDSRDDVLESRETAKDHLSRMSRVSMLVEQVQATLARPTEEVKKDIPSSSSPLPDKHSFERRPYISPASKIIGAQSMQPCDPAPLPVIKEHFDEHESASQADTSDYGDDEVDAAMDDVDPSITAATAVMCNGVFDHPVRPVDSASQHNVPGRYLDTIEEDLDEFEDDCDFTAEDLEHAVPLFDPSQQHEERAQTPNEFVSRPGSANITTAVAPNVVSHADVVDLSDDDDEFGGLDVDEEQFAAAEMAATQALRASAATQGSVRISNLPLI